MPKAKKFSTLEEIIELPKTDQNRIIVPNNLGQCPDDKVLVLQDDAIQQTQGGIYVPELSQERPYTGIVIKVGERTDGKPSKVDVEDRVIFGQHTGIEINLLGTVYILMKYNEILWNFKH